MAQSDNDKSEQKMNDKIEKLKQSPFKTMLFDRANFKRHNFFFMDEHGNFISAKHFKRFLNLMFFCFLILFFLFILGAIFLVFNIQKQKHLKAELLKAIDKTEKLQYQLVIIKADKFLKGEKRKKEERKKIAIKKAIISSNQIKVLGFKIYKEEGSSLFKINFSIVNKNNKEPFMGRLFIVLEPIADTKNNEKKPIIIFPAEVHNKKSIEDDPSKGQYFSTDKTNNFFKFKIESNKIRVQELKKATIHIYSMDNYFIKKQEFSSF